MYDIAFVHILCAHTRTHIHTLTCNTHTGRFRQQRKHTTISYMSQYGRHFSTLCVHYFYLSLMHAHVCVCNLNFRMLVNKWQSIRVSFTYEVRLHTPMEWIYEQYTFSISHTCGERDRDKHTHTLTQTHSYLQSQSNSLKKFLHTSENKPTN